MIRKRHTGRAFRRAGAAALGVILGAATIGAAVTASASSPLFTGELSLNKDYKIDGLNQAQAITTIAMAQLDLSATELGAIEGWCGDFIYTCAMEAGISSDIIPYTGSPYDLFNGVLDNGGTLVSGDAEAGDIVYYPLEGHIALALDSTTVIHGNYGGEDDFHSYVMTGELDYENTLIARPAYEDAAIEGYDEQNEGGISETPYEKYGDKYFFDWYMPEQCDHSYETEIEGDVFKTHTEIYTCSECGDTYTDENVPALLDWSIEDGCLTISGTGTMPDYREGTAPWYSQRKKITSIVIEDGVQNIGAYAFAGCENLEMIRWNDTLESIGEGAFDLCYKWKSIEFIGTMKSWDEHAYGEMNESVTWIEVTCHQAADPVKENIVEATCRETGSYDSVVYCSDCGWELSRETVKTEKAEHQWIAEKVYKKSTYTQQGTYRAVCSECGISRVLKAPLKAVVGCEDGLMDHKCEDGNWYYIKDNVVDVDLTTVAENVNGTWYVKNGAVDFTYTGVASDGEKLYYINKGMADFAFTGLAADTDGTWYFVDGAVDTSYTGLAWDENGTWLIKDGRVADAYNGIIIHDGSAHEVVNGQVY